MTRPDARAKVTGKARYAGDLRLAGMLEGHILRSAVAHGRIARMDIAAAARMPGVVAILTPADVAEYGVYGHGVRDRAVLPQDAVRFFGEPVAAVAATSKAAAKEAAAVIGVEYAPLPVIADMDAALASDAYAVHAGGNICSRTALAAGDVAGAWREAVHVFEDSWEFPSVYQYAMEPHTMVARWSDQGVTLWSTAQHPYMVQQEIARLFGFPLSRVQVIAPYLGGGFGSKSYTKYEPLAVALARKAGRPVRIEFSVGEAMLTNRRHDARITLKTGTDAAGRILVREARVLLDTGAYADNGPRVADAAARQLVGPYRVPAYAVEAMAIYSNKGPAGSYRAIGQTQVMWALESQMDDMAEALGMNPAAIRRINLAQVGDVVRRGERPLTADLPGDLDRLVALGEASGTWGLAITNAGVGASPVAQAMVRLFADASAVLAVGASEMGQGSRTVLREIAHRELGVPRERVAVVASDTGGTLYDRSTGSSRTTSVMGRAVQAACRQAIGQAGRLSERQEVIGIGVSGPLPGEGIGSPAKPVLWETGLGLADAVVDEETGEVRVTRYVGMADVGRAIDAELCGAQEEGAAIQALGHTLMEELVWEGAGLMNPNLIDYRVPTWDDIPDAWETVLIETGHGPGPYGATAAGEGGMVSVAPAVAGALRRRYGMRFTTLPLTPERVWQTLEAAGISAPLSR